MCNNPFEAVKQFMVACDQPIDGSNEAQHDLYKRLVEEEIQEFDDGITNKDDVETIDGIADSIWVLIGYAHSKGWDIEGAFNEVTRSNMSKIDAETGKVLKREDGKVQKPASYSPPDLTSFV